MSTSQKRDADMDRLLHAVLKPAPREGDAECPDAGLLAAFVEGGLTAAEQSALDAHIVNCGRCQEALAVLSPELPQEEGGEPVAAPESGWFTWVTRPRLRWLVPISAAATVAVVFFATRPLIAPEGEVPAGEVARMAQAPATLADVPAGAEDALREKPAVPEKQEYAGTARRDEAQKAVIGAAPASKAASEAVAEQSPAGVRARDKKPVEPAAELMAARVATEEKRTQPAIPAPQAPPPPAATPAVAQQAASLRKDARNLEAGLVTVAAPGGTVLWRFGAGGRLSRSGDAGATWHEQTSGVAADLLAGTAPSPVACWIVGSAGTVLLTTDGEHWERRPFPQTADLVAIGASDARAAIVTTRDGRRFETLDAGLTWSPKQ